MKYQNGKYNKALIATIVFYIIALGDLVINTLVAHIINGGVPLVHPSIMVGPIVFNFISVTISFTIATISLIIGLVFKMRDMKK